MISCLPLASGRNQFVVAINEEVAMTRSGNISPRRVLTYVAMLAGAMVTTMLLPAYAQQEVNPDWYDPYAVTAPAAAPSVAVTHSAQPALHAAQPAVALQRHEAAVKSVSSAVGAGRSHGKKTATEPKIVDIDVRRGGDQQVAEIIR
jgi:hypothetical protein